jgi:hypothetical protein
MFKLLITTYMGDGSDAALSTVVVNFTTKGKADDAMHQIQENRSAPTYVVIPLYRS